MGGRIWLEQARFGICAPVHAPVKSVEPAVFSGRREQPRRSLPAPLAQSSMRLDSLALLLTREAVAQRAPVTPGRRLTSVSPLRHQPDGDATVYTTLTTPDCPWSPAGWGLPA